MAGTDGGCHSTDGGWHFTGACAPMTTIAHRLALCGRSSVPEAGSLLFFSLNNSSGSTYPLAWHTPKKNPSCCSQVAGLAVHLLSKTFFWCLFHPKLHAFACFSRKW